VLYVSISAFTVFSSPNTLIMACTNDIVFPCNQPINKELLALLTPVAFCHALGHVMSNVSFAAVAVSFTHTIKGIKIWGTNAKVSYDKSH
jgi:hypothetical protein